MARIHNRLKAMTVGAGLALALTALAAADELGGLEFDTVDADGDGQITFAEIAAVAPRASRAAFDAFDTDDSGALDRPEYNAWLDEFVGRNPNEA